jgi:Uma2 family endonuclease
MAANPKTVERPRPTYAVADLFPREGEWTEEDYLALDTNHIIELSDGNLEVAEMPTDLHQLILGRLFAAIFAFVKQHGLGQVRFSALPVRLWPGKIREPDLVFMATTHLDRITQKYWGIPDLVAEIISPGNPDHDRVRKKQEYARAGIPEYWIVAPQEKTIEVYQLRTRQYRLDRTLDIDDTLTSTQLPGFELALADLFAKE